MAEPNSKDAILREMYRTSLDMIRIYNPTEEDFTILWDGFKHVVPHKNKDIGYGKGMRVVQRYLAKWYLKHMTDKLITEKQDRKIGELREKYENAGVEDSVLKAQLEVERNRALRTDNEVEVSRIAEIIWLGIEERYGMEDTEEQIIRDIDQRPIHEVVADKLENKVYKKQEEKVTTFPINKAKRQLEEEVSA